MGFIDALKKAESEFQAQEKIKAEEKQRIQDAISKIFVSTGELKETYEVVDTIFAMDSHQAGFFSQVNPSKAFDGVKLQLREKALQIGAQAVVSCQFEYRVALGQSVFGNKQCIEIFAYGTAVKVK